MAETSFVVLSWAPDEQSPPHCLQDVLLRQQAGEFKAEIALLISNHPDPATIAAAFGIPFKHEATGDKEALGIHGGSVLNALLRADPDVPEQSYRTDMANFSCLLRVSRSFQLSAWVVP